jgi:hypothetical protein
MMARHFIPQGVPMGRTGTGTAPESTLMGTWAGLPGKSDWVRVQHRPPVHELHSGRGLMWQQSREPAENRNAPSPAVSYHTVDAGYSFPGGICPRCNAIATRVPRRLRDLLVSIFIPVRRYQCHSENCGWEGTLRLKRYPKLASGQQ